MASPNPIQVAWSIYRSLRTVAPPAPAGVDEVDHDGLADALAQLRQGGTSSLPDIQGALAGYLARMSVVDPDALSRDAAKAFWLNLYNAGALRLAGDAFASGQDSVLRIPGGFQAPFIRIQGVELSLDDVEHAKVRRFSDPRIHGALVCGSVSCPTLRAEPYGGAALDRELDDQMRRFLAKGGAVPDAPSHTVSLSRVFSWFGSDFVRPARMPTFVPSRSRRVLSAIRPWLDGEASSLADRGARVEYQTYDWGLRCSVA